MNAVSCPPGKPPFAALCLAAVQSGSGKTTLAAGLLRALARRGLAVQGFKCGPDYVDPTFHTLASGLPARNLDTWMMGRQGAARVFARHAAPVDVAVVEGVMGLFDGRIGSDASGVTGTGSTIDLAAAVGIPVVLVVSARGMSASMAPLVDGFVRYAAEQSVRLVGVIANATGSPRHADLLREALAVRGLPPLLGALPRNAAWTLPERQLGLVPALELDPDGRCAALLDSLADAVETHIDVDGLLHLCRLPRPALPAVTDVAQASPQRLDIAQASPERLDIAQASPQRLDIAQASPARLAMAQASPERLDIAQASPQRLAMAQASPARLDIAQASPERLAIAKDDAFCFYYEDNEEALSRRGWTLIPFSPLADTVLPEAEAVYLGGGYPEVFAARLAANTAMHEALRRHAQQGGEIWAECGGYMYLCRELVTPEGRFPMAGLLDATAEMSDRLRSLGYREVSALLPFGLADAPRTLRGHEFHWSTIRHHSPVTPLYPELPDAGCVQGRIRAGYIHLYWGVPEAATAAPSTPLRGVLLLNGPSSAGKTSLARALQRQLADRGMDALILSVDALLEGCRAPSTHTAPPCLPRAFHAAVAEAAKDGTLVIADHVIGEDPLWLADLLNRLGPVPLTGIQVRCHARELARREQTRTDRPADTAHALRQHEIIHIALPREISVDTTHTSPEQCAEAVLRHFS